MKKISKIRRIKSWCLSIILLFLTAAVRVRAQMSSVEVAAPLEDSTEDFTWWYILLFGLTVGLVGAILWTIKSRKARKIAETETKKLGKNTRRKSNANSTDFDKELERRRKNQNLVRTNDRRADGKSHSVKKVINVLGDQLESYQIIKNEITEVSLPVFNIKQLEFSRPFVPLPLSNDEALMSAIEQTHDEFEEDESVRELALRILTAFKTRNSVESLSQMALYDLSSSLRSKAVSILSEFNHESVFETILQASADPTREVRAAAARALSKLTFDRADAWSRIFESGEKGRMMQAARAATESGIVKMSFDRLVHPDEKYSYEAFVLMALLIRAGETEEIFRALENYKNMNVRKALLHVVKITKDQETVERLCSLLEKKKLSSEMQKEGEKTIEGIGLVAA